MTDFPIERGHVLAFSRALGAQPPPDGGVPLTFPIAYAHFDPDWPLVMKPGRPWHGSGAEPGVRKGGGGLHAEQEFVYFRPLRTGETLTVHKRQGRTWTKEGRSGVLDFAERHTDFHDEAGELVARATTVTVVKR
jgi:MaoC dehydratase-like protein